MSKIVSFWVILALSSPIWLGVFLAQPAGHNLAAGSSGGVQAAAHPATHP
jgi:hypothetical protein